MPPTITLTGGTSLINNQTHRGPQIASTNISNPTVTEAVVLEPIVIHIKPSANCGAPKRKPINMSCFEKLKDSQRKKPYTQLKIPE